MADEWLDRVCCRPLSRPLAQACARHGLSANQVTAVSAGAGVVAGICFALPGVYPGLGALALAAGMVLDCTDGEVARMTQGDGWRGRVYDGLADLATSTALHAGMAVHLMLHGHVLGFAITAIVAFGLAAASGASEAWSAAVVDGLRQRLKGESVDEHLDRFASEPKGLLDRLLYAFMIRYAGVIRRAAGGSAGPDDAERYQAAQWVGPTHHHLGMVVAGVLAIQWPTAAYLTYLLVAIVPANLYLVGLRLRDRLRSRPMTASNR